VFGPGPITPAVRALIIVNVCLFVLTLFAGPFLINLFGLTPADVFTTRRVWPRRVWQPFTYLFLHSPSAFTHILFNMLAIWMFGVDLERRWGTPFFLKFYFVTGVGSAASVLLLSLLPLTWTASLWNSTTIGASGAVYGLLMAWALLFPHRQILFMFIFPLPARIFVLIVGGIALLSAIVASGGPVANVAHLGGLVIGWLYLKGPKDLRLTWRYHLTRWRMERMRRRFDVHRGGKDDGPWVH